MSLSHHDEFLSSSDAIFGECAHGIYRLDRIIVATPSHLTDSARAALVPALYSYWERFFRMTFGEFLRCLSLLVSPLRDCNRSLGNLRIKRELNQKSYEREHLVELIENGSVADARKGLAAASAAFERIERLYDSPIAFDDPEKWLILDANVRYEVLEKNCRLFGLNANELKAPLEIARFKLYPLLKKLVDTRNEIAHGKNIDPMTADQWNELKEFSLHLMNALQMYLHEALRKDSYILAS